MKIAVIIDAVRTPIGRAHKEKGYFREVRSDDLAVACVRALVERTGIDPAEIEDVVLGNTQQTGEQGLNAARAIALMAGLPVTTGGTPSSAESGSGSAKPGMGGRGTFSSHEAAAAVRGPSDFFSQTFRFILPHESTRFKTAD